MSADQISIIENKLAGMHGVRVLSGIMSPPLRQKQMTAHNSWFLAWGKPVLQSPQCSCTLFLPFSSLFPCVEVLNFEPPKLATVLEAVRSCIAVHSCSKFTCITAAGSSAFQHWNSTHLRQKISCNQEAGVACA